MSESKTKKGEIVAGTAHSPFTVVLYEGNEPVQTLSFADRADAELVVERWASGQYQLLNE